MCEKAGHTPQFWGRVLTSPLFCVRILLSPLFFCKNFDISTILKNDFDYLPSSKENFGTSTYLLNIVWVKVPTCQNSSTEYWGFQNSY